VAGNNRQTGRYPETAFGEISAQTQVDTARFPELAPLFRIRKCAMCAMAVAPEGFHGTEKILAWKPTASPGLSGEPK